MVNLGVLGIVGYQVYKRPSLVTEPCVNARPLAIISGGLIGLFALEGWATDAYLNTPQVHLYSSKPILRWNVILNLFRARRSFTMPKTRVTIYITVRKKSSCALK
jgi:hypothetical protein